MNSFVGFENYELDEFINANCYASDGSYNCVICNYSNKKSQNVKTHIETNHVSESMKKSHCNYCDYVGPSRTALRFHMKKHK